MTVPAWLIAVVRTITQAIIAQLLSSGVVIGALTWLETNAGIALTEGQLTTAAFGLAMGLVVALVNWAGKFPAFQWVNQVFSLGLANTPAVYDKAGTTGTPDTHVDMGGENVAGTEKGAVTLGAILAVAALIMAVLVLVGAGSGVPWLAIAVGCLALACLVGGTQIG